MFDRNTLRSDFIAGLTVALVLIPQSLAYAQLAGLPVQFGLYAALFPPFAAAFFGSSKYLSTGPVAVLSLMTAAALTPYFEAGSSAYIVSAIMLSLCFGLFQVLLGVFKLGGLVSFLSHPVIYGFTNASAIIIATTQLSKFFGITVDAYEHHYQTVFAVFMKAVTDINWNTFIFGMISLLSMVALKRANKRIPAVLIVVFISIIISQLFHYEGALVGYIPSGFPQFTIPDFDLRSVMPLGLTIVTMALIGFTEAISVAEAIAVKTKTKVDPNKELIGQGVANIIGSFFQSYPVSGSFSRTAVNYQAGAKTKFSSFFVSIFVLLALLFFTRYIYNLPQVVLAAIIVFSVSGLVDFKKIKKIWINNKFDAISAVLTFVGTLYFAPHLENGILLGVIFSIGYYMYRSAHPRVVFLSKYKDGLYHDAERYKLDTCQNIAIVRLDAPLFFANVSYFEEEIVDYLAKNKNIQFVVIVASGINEMDSSGEEMLSSMLETLKEAKKELYFSRVKAPIYEILKRSGFVEEVGNSHFFPTTREAVHFLLKKLEHEKLHGDETSCPLEKYIKTSSTVHTVQDKRETIAYFYNKLLKK